MLTGLDLMSLHRDVPIDTECLVITEFVMKKVQKAGFCVVIKPNCIYVF